MVKWRNAAEGTRDSRADNWVYDSPRARRVAEARDSEKAERGKETMSEGVEKAKERAQEMKERTKEYAQDTEEKTMADKANEGTNKAKEKTAETLKSVGEKAKQTVQGAWEAAKDTTHKIKETVVGKDNDDHGEDGREILEFRRKGE